jgi:hypothetical protein
LKILFSCFPIFVSWVEIPSPIEKQKRTFPSWNQTSRTRDFVDTNFRLLNVWIDDRSRISEQGIASEPERLGASSWWANHRERKLKMTQPPSIPFHLI